jgi:phosphinothricin acetyltransferase
MEAIVIRRAEQGDLPGLLAIYNHYVRETPATFDIEPRTLAQRQAWFDSFAATGRYQCFVAVKDGEPAGWASSYRYNDRAAYDPTVGSSIYLTRPARGQGLGRQLYAALFEALAREDIHRVFAGIVPPNPASIGLHESFGFRLAGTLTEVGRKFGRFWDVALYLKSF